jgi:hypothetical protein
MVNFVNLQLHGVFDAIDDGRGGKPIVDRFIDDKAGPVDWEDIADRWGMTEAEVAEELAVERAAL